MLSVIVFTSTSSSGLLLDVSSLAESLTFTTNEHGFASLDAFVPLTLAEQFRLYDRPGLPHVVVSDNGGVVWEGRLEDVEITGDGIRLGAFGYQRALSDAPYTSLWSTDRVDLWRPVTPQDSGAYRPDRWEIDTTNRLYIAPRENEYYDITDDRGAVTFAEPHLGLRNVQEVDFTYNVTVPSATWVARLLSYTDAWGGVTVEWTQTGSGSGSTTVSLTSPNPRLVFELFYNSGTETQWTGARTGSAYMLITGLRVKSTTSANVYSDEIVRGIIGTVSGENSSQLSSSTALVDSPALDLYNELYSDQFPAEILDRLAFVGDNSSPSRRYEWSIWNDRILRFNYRGKYSRVWYVDISDLQLARTINALRNSAYATYSESAGRTLRTANSSDSGSILRWGVTRRAAWGSRTANSTQAGVERATFLNDNKDPKPRVQIQFSELYDASGARWPLYVCRATDTVIIRNLPPTLSADIDRIRSFRIIETSYDAVSDVLTVTPESPLPTLDWQIARWAAGTEIE